MKWITVLLGVLLASQIHAQDVSLSVGVSNGYVDHGQVVGESGKLAVQPSISVGIGNLSLGASGNAFLQDRDALKDNDEIELSGAYTFSKSGYNLSVGIAHDLYFVSDSDANDNATSIVGALSLDGFSPVLSVSRNFADSERMAFDYYVSLSADADFKRLNIDVSVSVSDADGWAFHNATGKASVDIPVGNAVLSPGVACVFVDSDTQHYVVGVGLSF